MERSFLQPTLEQTQALKAINDPLGRMLNNGDNILECCNSMRSIHKELVEVNRKYSLQNSDHSIPKDHLEVVQTLPQGKVRMRCLALFVTKLEMMGFQHAYPEQYLLNKSVYYF